MAHRCARALLSALLVAIPPAFAAAPYPDKPVRVVVPAAAGTRPDRIAHLVSPLLGAHFGQRFIVDNRSGAEGLLGTELAARATADGCTLVVGMPATLTTMSLRRMKPSYDPLKDFFPIGLVASSPFVLAVHPSLPAASVAELVSLARKDRGRMSYGVTRTGSTAHAAMELLQAAVRIDLKQQGHRARADSLGQLLTGSIDVGMLDLHDALDHVRARRLRALAVTASRRSAALPHVPTASEAGIADFEASKWTALLAPARTPREIVDELGIGLRRALANPGARWQLAQEGMQPGDGDSGTLATLLKRELAHYGRLAHPLSIRWP